MHKAKDFSIDFQKILDERFIVERHKKTSILIELLNHTLKSHHASSVLSFGLDWSQTYLTMSFPTIFPRMFSSQPFAVYWTPLNEVPRLRNSAWMAPYVRHPLALQKFTKAPPSAFQQRSIELVALEFLEDLVEFMFEKALIVNDHLISLDPSLTSLEQIYMLGDLSQDSIEYRLDE